MALGTWLDPTTNRWVELYNKVDDLPVTFPRGDNVAFITASTDMSETGRQLLLYAPPTASAPAHPTITVRGFAVPVLPSFVGTSRSGTMRWRMAEPSGSERAQLMADDGVSPLFEFTFWVCVFILVAMALAGGLAYAVSWAIWLGPEQERTKQAAVIAESIKIETDEDVDINADGQADKRVVTFGNGTVYESALSDYGAAALGTSGGIVTNEGYDWGDWQSMKIPGWVWYAAAGIAIVGVSGAVLYKYRKSAPARALISAGKFAGRTAVGAAKGAVGAAKAIKEEVIT